MITAKELTSDHSLTSSSIVNVDVLQTKLNQF